MGDVALTEKVVQALGQLLVSIENSSAEDMDPAMAGNLVEDVSFVLSELSGQERGDLTAIFGRIADSEPDPDNREALRRLPETLGLDAD
ncbi:hypothetical protein [Streptacidiphilus jiangxiensis]|uniref:Uncharacterized protein n=1 Tax=Streptacidiphilus jiangxiensis TaxID=235985 RepID=A0A1H7RK55_STRJI|nr:hypothetical protein [Streptacidiphilus jiangxiensis]SEL60398.1 hypothetical protein SAMN05414137_110171 [Streptacidiphilus jiangxiensis]